VSNVDPLGGSNTTIVKFRSSTSLHVGTVLRERYVLEQVLGEGGMGKVFLANDREVIGSNPYVAIKVLGDVFREHPQSINALRREATNAQKLNHPNIVGVYNFDRDGPNVFLVMEYMKGSSLDHFIKRNKSGVPFDEAWPIVQSCAQALAYMHSKEIVHSDFKPGNVFITEDGDIKVLDLGIARSIDETAALDGRTRFDAAVLGALTPQYASCEMFEGLKPDSRDDVYALGCVAYELLTGQHPYQQLPSIEARKKSVTATKPKGLRKRQWRALQRSIALDRASRTPTAAAFLEEFGPTRQAKRAGPWIAGALTALVAVGVWAVFAPSRSSDQQFIDELLATTTSGSATPDQVHNWREQAKFNLDEAKQAFENGQDERGGYFLHDGPNSARYLYGLLLSRAPALADREFGAKGMLSVSKTYAIPAVRHYQSHDPTGALRFVCEGLGVNSQEPNLLALYSKYKRDLSAHQFGAIDECTWIPWKTETPP
jgi:serine/threonine protein kinase